MIAIPKPLNVTGLFLANLIAAVAGPPIITAFIPVPPTLSLILSKEFVVTFALGYLSYLIWKSTTAKWVWIAGLCWFGQRAVVLWTNQSAVRAMTGSHGAFPLLYPGPDPQSSSDWITYTLVFLRTVFYAGGALLCSRFGGTATLDAEQALSDHESDAHTTPSPGVRDSVRPDAS